jgi:sulfite reductase alpha subunit-like flavoprotein
MGYVYDGPVLRQVAMFEYLSPRSLANPQATLEYLELHQAAQEFRLELEHRASLDAHCQWYYQVAAENQRDLEQMRSEIDLLTMFNRRSA